MDKSLVTPIPNFSNQQNVPDHPSTSPQKASPISHMCPATSYWCSFVIFMRGSTVAESA